MKLINKHIKNKLEMINWNKFKIFPNAKIADVINENPYMLLLLQHFQINNTLDEKSIKDICRENKLTGNLFISFVNLYKGILPISLNTFLFDDINSIIMFLKNSHQYYIRDKFPKIERLIKKLNKTIDKKIALMIEKYFREYYKEVIQHLKYEDEIAFPYIKELFVQQIIRSNYSIKDYSKHHDDIEEKLLDLKNLLLKYLPAGKTHKNRRELLINLYELEYDLNIHSKIEEVILIPLVEKLETDLKK